MQAIDKDGSGSIDPGELSKLGGNMSKVGASGDRNDMSGMGNMTNVRNLSNMSHLSNMDNMNSMGNMSNMSNISDMNNTSNMSSAGNMSNATSAEWQLLDQWHEKLTDKYPAVGYTAVEPTAESPLPRELTQTVQLMASRGGLDAEQIASMLKLEVDKVQATLEASARRMLDRRPWQRGASSATTTASAGILREVGAFVSSPKQVEDPLLVDDKDEWRVVGVDSPELE